jgi:hypothetical protein
MLTIAAVPLTADVQFEIGPSTYRTSEFRIKREEVAVNSQLHIYPVDCLRIAYSYKPLGDLQRETAE